MSSPERPPIVVVSCLVLQDLLANLLPEGLAQQITFMDYGLHRVPAKMTGALQEVLEGLARDGQLMAYRHESFWQCMDTLRDKKLLEKLWESGEAPWKTW